MSCCVASLRGSEGFIMDAVGLRNNIGKGREGTMYHVVIPMMVRSKGMNGIRHHIQANVNDAASKLKVRWWLERLNDELIRQGQINGPA